MAHLTYSSALDHSMGKEASLLYSQPCTAFPEATKLPFLSRILFKAISASDGIVWVFRGLHDGLRPDQCLDLQ